MKHLLVKAKEGFEVIAGTQRSQAATMVLEPGESTGGPHNKHKGSDQWLFVLAGAGKAIVEREQVNLAEGELLLIEAGETHEITNTGDRPLETLNFYAPSEY